MQKGASSLQKNSTRKGTVKERERRELELSASIVGHDLINYLQLAMLRLDELEQSIGNKSSEISANIMSIRDIIDRMSVILRYLGLPIEVTDDPLVSVLEQIADHTHAIYNDLEIRFEADDEARQLRVHGGYLMPLVFGNLFRNSVEHGGKGVIVSVRVRREGNSAEITISDTGPGIPEHIRERLFQKGVSTKGGGLGLYLTKRIIETHEGNIQLIDSDDGAVFRILLPLQD